MATPTVVFPWVPGLTLTVRIVKVTDDSITFTSASCVERANADGIYEATFSNPAATDYYVIPLLSGVPVEGSGIVFGVQNDSGTYYESSLAAPGAVTLSAGDITDIADAVVSGITAIPGLSVQVTSPVDTTGSITITQGDSYLAANTRSINIALTGSLPSLETACSLKVTVGSTSTTYTGAITVNSATSYTCKFDLTGTQTALLPAGVFTYELEVTYLSTTNKWTPSSGIFTVLGQAA